MATRNNTSVLIRGAVAIAFLLFLPFWFNKRFQPKPKPDQFKLGEDAAVVDQDAGLAAQDSAEADRSTDDVMEKPEDPTVDEEVPDPEQSDPEQSDPEQSDPEQSDPEQPDPAQGDTEQRDTEQDAAEPDDAESGKNDGSRL